MMDKAIINFPQQFKFEPIIVGDWRLVKYQSYIVCGMGGSHLAADVLKLLRPELNLVIHSDYGLPPVTSEVLKNSLVIISSYSGNTEEAIDGFKAAQAQKLKVAVMAVGGQLIELAKENKVAYVELPDDGIQPRSALGFSLRALLKIINDEELLADTLKLSEQLNPAELQNQGQELAEQTKEMAPVIYASARNYALAYNWKIKLNETGKIPAFYNLLPELNHNEMNGFDYNENSQDLAKKFVFIMLKDGQDNARIIKRMEVLTNLLTRRELPVLTVELKGENKLEAIFNNLLLADWLAYYTALQYGTDPEPVPMVEEFKKLMANGS